MKKFVTLFCVLISTLMTFAGESKLSLQNGLAEQEIEEFYIFQCGTLEEMTKILKVEVRDLSDADIEEVIKSRKINLSIIREGMPAIKKLIAEGSKNDTGGFGALLACGVVNNISEKVKERGCLDLETNDVVSEGPGFAICKEMLSKVKK